MDDEGMLERGCRHADAYRHAAQCPANDAMRGGDERLSPANRARSGRLGRTEREYKVNKS
jgi:hypothetical protein